jgi:hypothetical protein
MVCLEVTGNISEKGVREMQRRLEEEGIEILGRRKRGDES